MHKQEKRFDLEKQLLSQTALRLKIAGRNQQSQPQQLKIVFFS